MVEKQSKNRNVYLLFTLVKIKMRNELIFNKLRKMFVTAGGFEPPTLRAEI